MKEVFVIAGTRTPIGDFGGSLRDVSAITLGVTAIESVIGRAGIDKKLIEMTTMGNNFDTINHNFARIVAVKAGIPIESPAFQINATCVSGMQATISGVQAIQLNDVDIMVAGGTESMSNAPYLLTKARWGQRFRHGAMIDPIWGAMQEPALGVGMGLTAENLAEQYRISRQEQDEFSLLSQKRACNAISEGRFKDEITPVVIPQGKKAPKSVDTDEHPKADVTLEKLSQLAPAFKQGGTVTAGNSCGINDAAAAVVLASETKVKELSLKPLARIVAYSQVGVDPSYMGIGPVPATKLVLKRAGMSLDQIQLIECNEAFAAQYLACEKELGWDRNIVNVNGSGISLGHPVGCTGCRLIVTLIYEMKKRNLRYGLATLCAGGGQGFAVVVENV
jgi:acetyl-CoA C-acetyltransferase